jgi:hypothetical protein
MFCIFYIRIDGITLDSIYLAPGARVQCSTTAIAADGKKGVETWSKAITVSSKKGLCPRKSDAFGSDPYLSKIRYSGKSILLIN